MYEQYGRGLEEVVFRLPTGVTEPYLLRHDRPNVGVFARTSAGQVILTRQFRPGPGAVVYEMPGGYVDADESPAAAAARELLEETGYAGEVTIVGEWYTDSYSNAVRHCAVATGCVERAAPHEDDAGLVEIQLASLDEFVAILRSGQLIDVDLAYRALDHLGLLPP